MTTKAVRELTRKLEHSENARRHQLRDLERNQITAHLTGPLRRLNNLYIDLLEAADPTQGRHLNPASGPRHPDDRPLPHQPTESRRRQVKAIDRELDRLADRMARMLGDPIDYIDPAVTCETCGRTENPHRHKHRKVDQARRFLETAFTGGPVPQHVLCALAEDQGITYSTLRRAAAQLGIKPQQKEGFWWWTLPDRDGIR